MLNKLIPKIFYENIQIGLDTFVKGLNCEIVYSDFEIEEPFCQVSRDWINLQLVQNTEFALKDRPELYIETDDINSIYSEIIGRAPHLLHPNLKEIKIRPWNAHEFAIVDASGVCIVFRQWNI